MAKKAADTYEEEVDKALRGIVSAIEPFSGCYLVYCNRNCANHGNVTPNADHVVYGIRRWPNLKPKLNDFNKIHVVLMVLTVIYLAASFVTINTYRAS